MNRTLKFVWFILVWTSAVCAEVGVWNKNFYCLYELEALKECEPSKWCLWSANNSPIEFGVAEKLFGMATKINPPVYSRDKNYERYKQELLAWREVTDLKPEKVGVVTALSLPENESIREMVFDQIPLEELKGSDGFQLLVSFMDKNLGKDDMADSLEKFEEFEDCQRGNESVKEFVDKFDSKYRKIEKKKMILPQEILAFKLLRKARITREEKMLVLTGMDYKLRDSLYEQAKESLLKFKGGFEKEMNQADSIRLEEVFATTGFYGKGRGRGRGRSHYRRTSRSLSTRRLNPTGADGRVYTCRACGSYRHLIANCPDSWENRGRASVNATEVTNEQVVLFTGYDSTSDLQTLNVEARSCAVLDSACSSTVCGKAWIKTFLDAISDEDRLKVVCREGQRVFKFGGGTTLKSIEEFEIPAYLAEKAVTIRTDVVESDIPLLLSRTAMKTAKIKLDLENDVAEIFGKEVVLNLTSSGHYCIPIDKTEEVFIESVFSAKLETAFGADRKRTLLKLHRQFAHPPNKRLIALLKDAGVWQDDYESDLQEIQENCMLCKLYAKTPPRPVVSLPMASCFNEKIAMDLKFWRNKWILHIIDMWSRYTISLFIERKKPSCVLDGLMKNWVGVFGLMSSILTDNGGEFTSEEIREVASILNIKIKTTAAYSPYQNGLCERVHSVTDMMLEKLYSENQNTKPETLLSWANMARNTLQMWNGFSSHQLVFGTNPQLPNVMSAKLPALEGTTTSETFASHLNALHASRRAYAQSESDERLRRALRSKVRASEEKYENGDEVFYKRDGKDRWLGPGKVVFQDGKVVFIRHGSVFVRVAPNRLSKIKTSTITKESNTVEDEDVFSEEIGTTKESYSESDKKTSILKKNDEVSLKLPESEEWSKGKILGRAGKATGKNCQWYNVEMESGTKMSVNLETTEWRKLPLEEVFSVVVPRNQHDGAECTQAKREELEKLKSFQAYDVVEDTGQNRISTRWVIVSKQNIFKARLVARGFEEETDIQSDSPTVGKSALRLFICISAHKCWNVKTTDIKSAFLQGKLLERDVFIKPPPEAEVPCEKLWKLRHCLYGLNDGARQFFLSVKEELIKLGCIQSKLDPALFLYFDENKRLVGMICSHVDDFLHSGEDIFDRIVMNSLRRRFSAGKMECDDFSYVGFKIQKTKYGVLIDQSEYVSNLENITLCPERVSKKHEPLNREEQTNLRQLVGRLNWAVRGTRPDMAFETIELSTKLKSAIVGDLARAVKAINKLKDTRSVIYFPQLSNVVGWKLTLFSDAAHANLSDGVGSMGAFILFLVDQEGNSCPLTWQANKIKRVVRSTIAAEALSLQEGLESCFYHKSLLQEILGCDIPICAFVDNKSVVDAIYSTKLVDDKRLRIDIGAIKESVQKEEVHVIKWCSGENQLANCMTKRGASGYGLLSILKSGRMPAVFSVI